MCSFIFQYIAYRAYRIAQQLFLKTTLFFISQLCVVLFFSIITIMCSFYFSVFYFPKYVDTRTAMTQTADRIR